MDMTKKIFILSVITVFMLFNIVAYASNDVKEELIKRTEFSKTVVVNDEYNRYYNYGDGYVIKYPNDFKINESLAEIKIVLENENTEIEIFYDDFSKRNENSDIYTAYSNKNIVDNEYIDVEVNGSFFLDKYKVNLLRWNRKKLKGIDEDKNHYISGEIIKNEKEIYTVFIKTSRSDFPYLEIIENFSFIPKSAPMKNSKIFKKGDMKLNNEALEFYNKYLLENKSLKWGIFEPTAPTSMEYLNSLEKNLDHEFTYLLKYQHLNSKLDLNELYNAAKENKYLELTLQTTIHGGEFNKNINYEILDGEYDDFLYDYANYIKSFGEPVLFRLNNEMNGDWCKYNALYNTKDTEIYKALWKYVYNIFEENGVDNAIWVWNPNNRDFPSFKWNHYINYYPGNEYVDVIGLTAYNTGSYYEGEYFEGFDTLYEPIYIEYLELFDYPFIITEFAANSVGGDKVQWIEDMFNSIKKYDNIKAAIWFNGVDLDAGGKPARIYRLDENKAVINKFKEMLKSY